jgi:ferredoxin-NADP reductase
MTAQGLLLLILLGILLQLLVYAGVALFRHWLDFQALKEQSGVPRDAAMPTDKDDTASTRPAWQGDREFRVCRREYEDAAHSVCSFHLCPVDGKPLPAFLPGQFLTFVLEIHDPMSGEPKSIMRCYSLSDRPHADHYRISIKRIPPGATGLPPGLSSSHFHDHVQVGDVLRVKAPAGHFHLDPVSAHPVVLIAGGIGITPLFSMLSATLRVHPEREVWLFFGARNGREIPMRAALEDLERAHANFHLHVCFSQPADDDRLGRDYAHAGRVDIPLLRMHLGFKPYHFYLCGPAALMESLVPGLEDWGVPAAQIHYEAFGPASVTRRAQASDTPRAVTFARSGRSIAWTGADGSLLELAEANGIRVDSGCRAGCCGACRTEIEAGEVYYEQQPEFEVEPGGCLMCLARPTADLVLAA